MRMPQRAITLLGPTRRYDFFLSFVYYIVKSFATFLHFNYKIFYVYERI